MTRSAKQMTGAKRTRHKTSRRGNRAQEFVSYLMAIEDWDWSFSYGVGQDRFDEGLYADHRQLQLRGTLTVPSKKAQTAELTLIPADDRDAPNGLQRRPLGVGGVHLYRGKLSAYLGMPTDALAPVLQMLIAGKFRFADLYGERLRYGRARITSYRLEMNIDEEDMPTDW